MIDGAKKKWLSMHSLSGTFAEVVPLLMDTDRDSCVDLWWYIPFPLKTSPSAFSQDHTAATALALLKREQCCSCRRLEYVVDALSA